MDVVYLFLTEMMKEETFKLFHEPLLAYDSFETLNGENIFFPLVDPFYPKEYFEFPNLYYEEKRYE